MDIYVLILPLLIGWILDKLLGDPVGLPHPVVGFGKLISFCEERWNCGEQGPDTNRGRRYHHIRCDYADSACHREVEQ